MQIAEKLGKSPAQVVLRWGLQRGTSVLPKSTNFDRLRSNLEVTEWSLSDEDMKALSSIEDQVSLLSASSFASRLVLGSFSDFLFAALMIFIFVRNSLNLIPRFVLPFWSGSV